jgi:hypothetical protein
MSDNAAQPGAAASPAELLEQVNALRRRARAARHAYWLPVLLFGVLTLVPAYWYIEPDRGPDESVGIQPTPVLAGLGGDFLTRSSVIGWYWLVALIGSYLLTLGWYRWHAQRVGVQTSTRGYLVAGVVGTSIGLALPFILRYLILNTGTPVGDATEWLTVPLSAMGNRGVVPHLIIGMGLLVLSRLERSWQLAAIAAGYTITVILVSLYFMSQGSDGTVEGSTFMLAAILPSPILIAGGVLALVSARRSRA